MKACRLGLSTVCLIVLACAYSASAASITRLPDWLASRSIRKLEMLPDGRNFIGVDGTDVFRWSVDGGRTNLGTLPETSGPENLRLTPRSISNDGSTIIGTIDGGFLGIPSGFMWTEAGGIVPMPESLDGSIHSALPAAVSADGKVIVGNAIQDDGSGTSHGIPFRWTPSTGTTSLGFDGFVLEISADGTVVVGGRPLTDTTSEALRWTEAKGAVGLGYFPSTRHSSFIYALSDDGNVIFGGSFSGDSFIGPRGFRWTESAGMEILSPRGDDHTVFATSANGDFAFGLMRTLITDASGPRINGEDFVWTAAGGLETLSEFLESRGLFELEPIKTPTNIDILSDVSADGRILFGTSMTFVYGSDPYTPQVHQELWLVDLSAVPEPSTIVIFASAAFATLASARPRNRRGQK